MGCKGSLLWVCCSQMPGRWENIWSTILDAPKSSTLPECSLHVPSACPLCSPQGHGHVCIPCREKIVSMEFMRKYIHVAKMIKPVLTQESADYIAEEYSRLRSQNQMNSDIARVSSIFSLITPGGKPRHTLLFNITGAFLPQSEWLRLERSCGCELLVLQQSGVNQMLM